MSKTDLKKFLKDKDAAFLSNLILEIYSASKQAKEWLDFYVDPQEEDLYDTYCARICSVFFTIRGTKPAPSFTKCKSIIAQYKKCSPPAERIADIMIYCLECAVAASDERGFDFSFYNAVDNMGAQLVTHVVKTGIAQEYKSRIHDIYRRSKNIQGDCAFQEFLKDLE